MIALTAPVTQCQEYNKIEEHLKTQGIAQVTGLGETALSVINYCMSRGKARSVMITADTRRGAMLLEESRFFQKNVYLYPEKDALFFSADLKSNSIVAQRMEIIRHLMEDEEALVILPVSALMEKLPGLEHIRENCLSIEVGSVYIIEQLAKTLVHLGYTSRGMVEQAGDFARRGGILDVYPLSSDCPYRIEFWGDEVDSIRSFDVESQRSIQQLEKLMLYPAGEMVLDESRMYAGLKEIEAEAKTYMEKLKAEFKTTEASRVKHNLEKLRLELLDLKRMEAADGYIHYFFSSLGSVLDYFPEDTVLFVDQPEAVLEGLRGYCTEWKDSMYMRLQGGYILPKQRQLMYTYEEVLEKLKTYPMVLGQSFQQEIKEFGELQPVAWEFNAVYSYSNRFEILVKDIREWKKKQYRILLLCNSESRAKRIYQELQEYEISSFLNYKMDRELCPGELMVSVGRLARGFALVDAGFVVVSEGDMFSSKSDKKGYKKKKNTQDYIRSFEDLSIGDYVVHVNHGIGIYKGIEQIEVDHIKKDYLVIEYKGNSRLYILVSQLDLLQKYSSKEGAKPALDKLGGTSWSNTKAKVKTHLAEVAKDLVKLYAARSLKKGYAYGPDNAWQREFEEEFPYEETADQMRAINETKADMQSQKIMDRLICGDVGFGKTEIAIRAAFKAVQESKQVAYLVPTTVLAQQHYNTFSKRMANYPVKVKMLSRLTTPKERKEILSGLERGEVDILIGTHRIMSKDVVYKDLGLLIIDEEQRFGVKHKETIKKMKDDIDVLTLTATPIPRTLHMSLIGVRDMSLLEEAPVNRRAIQTYVMGYNEEIVREAIKRELNRDGQVFYVHNRVNGMESFCERVQNLIPEAKVAYAHGQMPERELERIMYEFMEGKIDVLVATTIIETGLDISNVNTIIIDQANQLGLAQLYQLRGRVGRSKRQGYAFLMYDAWKLLTEEAEQRLEAMREMTNLGSGYRIAMRDLEIRGAGNLLGTTQHGHLEAVGYELYCKMLNDAILEEQGETVEETFETRIEIAVDAYIPSTYVHNEIEKLKLYKRIADIRTLEQLEDMQDELIDRFGDMPVAVENLLQIAWIKALANAAYITEVALKGQNIHLTMKPDARVDTTRLDEFIKGYHGRLRLDLSKEPTFVYRVDKGNAKETFKCVENVINDISGLLLK